MTSLGKNNGFRCRKNGLRGRGIRAKLMRKIQEMSAFRAFFDMKILPLWPKITNFAPRITKRLRFVKRATARKTQIQPINNLIIQHKKRQESMERTNHHHHHKHRHIDDSEIFKQQSLGAIRRRKIISRVLFTVLSIVAACIVAFIAWSMIYDK